MQSRSRACGRLGFPILDEIRVQGWGRTRQTAARAVGAEALAEAEAVHAAARSAVRCILLLADIEVGDDRNVIARTVVCR